jgi:hypothetical protein
MTEVLRVDFASFLVFFLLAVVVVRWCRSRSRSRARTVQVDVDVAEKWKAPPRSEDGEMRACALG